MTTVETLSAAITSGKTTEDRAPHAEEMGKLVAKRMGDPCPYLLAVQARAA